MHGWLAKAPMLPRYTECLAAVTLQLEKSSLFFLIPPFLLSAFNSSFMGAEESSYHRAAPRAKNEIGRGGEGGREWEAGGLECLCDTEREKQTEKEEERRLCVRFTS